jgi:hypothetical protein
MTQQLKLIKLLTRKRGCTSVDIVNGLPSVTPHRRISDLKDKGWTILKKKQDDGLTVYFGKPPKK